MIQVSLVVLAMSIGAVALLPASRKQKIFMMGLLTIVAATNMLLNWLGP